MNSTIAFKSRDIIQFDFESREVLVAVEETIALVINERYRVNLLFSPVQVEELCVGYLLSEGLIDSFDQVKKVECKPGDATIQVWIWTESKMDFFHWTEIRSSGCLGVKQQYQDLNFKLGNHGKISPKVIFKAQDAMKSMGKTWRSSGGTHMSALCDLNGNVIYFAEDIGRHNTLDKIIGSAAIMNTCMNDKMVITSGRLSAAMVSKVARAR
ncbi:MAG: formate dehydrogenase accessory sulfurtransferase FdhD, partial [Promethearchaeota archaeon]